MELRSITKTDLENKVLELCEKSLFPLGFRIVDLDCRLGARSLLRIFIEKIEVSEQQVSVEDCRRASETLDPVLDAATWMPGGYDLEVSSPGLDRRLRLREDFESVVGNEVKLKLGVPQEGSRNIQGKLEGVEGDCLVIDFQKKKMSIPIQHVVRANRVWHF